VMDMKKIFVISAGLYAAAAAPALAYSPNNVSLASDVFVERTEIDANGKARTTLEEPKVVVPGDRLVFVLNYQNKGKAPATNFVVTNPLPGAVLYQGSADSSAIVSIDGGRNWGALSDLTVRDKDGSVRFARMDDVTHVRWIIAQPIPANGAGKLMFRGIVK
jgi:uncharacterized repeat protein (TIGR01451 family)